MGGKDEGHGRNSRVPVTCPIPDTNAFVRLLGTGARHIVQLYPLSPSYSALIATIGSTRVARRAGSKHATTPVATSTVTIPA